MGLAGCRVLVTGAGGFIGSHLVEALVEEGALVRAMVHYNSRSDWGQISLLPEATQKQLEVVRSDIEDPFAVQEAVKGCHVVFHLAALIAIPYSYQAPEEYVTTNIKGTLNVLQACREYDTARLVQTSTSEVYGTACYTPIDEAHPLQAQSPYAASKIAADKLAESYYLSFDLPVTIVRPFNTYGPRQSARAVIPTIISQALKNTIIRLGSLSPVRDFTYVADTVAGFIAAAKSEQSVGQVINTGSGRAVSIRKVVEMISELLGKDLSVTTSEERVRPGKSEVYKLICDNLRARELLDWAPIYTLEAGLRETIDWIANNQERFKPELYVI